MSAASEILSATVQSSGHRLTILKPAPRDAEGWTDFSVEIETPGLRAYGKVADLGPSTIHDFFAELEANSRSWNGERRWQSIEGELEVSATIDRLGHIDCQITLRSSNQPRGWTGGCHLMIESGAQLSSFVRDLKPLFASA